GRLAGNGVRRHPSCGRGGERARGHGENQVVSAWATERTAARGTHDPARHLRGVVPGGWLRQRGRGEGLLPSQHRAAPSSPYRGVDQPVTFAAKGHRRTLPGLRGRAATALRLCHPVSRMALSTTYPTS